MQDFIASYLVQKKECALPLLGNFKIQNVPAFLDVADKKMIPFTSEVVYTENANHTAGAFTNYIAGVQNISLHEAEEKINNWCLQTKMKLDDGKRINFKSIGNLLKNEAGNIIFEKQHELDFYEALSVERVIHKNEEHAIRVGDKETTSAAMNEYYNYEVVDEKSSWKKWAIALFILSFLGLLIYFTGHKSSDAGMGNQSSFPVRQPPSTYSVPR